MLCVEIVKLRKGQSNLTNSEGTIKLLLPRSLKINTLSDKYPNRKCFFREGHGCVTLAHCSKFCFYNIILAIVLQGCLIILVGLSTCQNILKRSLHVFIIIFNPALLQQLANCNEFLLNVQLIPVSVHLGIVCCQYGPTIG